MKEVGKLWSITRRFYLMILGIVLIMAICNSVYLCNYGRIAFAGKSVEMTIVEKLSLQAGNATITPVNLAQMVDMKREDMTILGSFWTSVGIVFMLFIRYFAYMDGRTREFQTTWPITTRKRVLFDYLTMLSILVIGWATEVVIFLVAGNHYNKVAERVLMEKSMDTSAFSDAALSASNKTFLLLMVLFLLFELIFYTFVFLGMMMAKNPLLGLPVCYMVYGTVTMLVERMLMRVWEYENRMGNFIYPNSESSIFKFLYGIDDLMYSKERIYNQIEIYVREGRTGYEEYLSQVNVMSAGTGIAILLLLEVGMVFMIIWISKRKELSGGKLLFSKGADISFFICFLLFLYLILTLVFSQFAVFIGIGFVGVIGFILIRKKGVGNRQIPDVKKWEVK